jgi:uncharacterized protein YigE (DUF2233 family)
VNFKFLIFLLILFTENSKSQENFLDFTADSPKYHIELRLLDKSGKPLGSFKRLIKELDSEGRELTFAMNAGIYMQNQMPLGLYIENGKTYRKLNTKKNLYGNFYLQPNGVFLISGGKAHIIETGAFSDFSKTNKVQYANQSGPMLLINGKNNQSLSKYDKNKVVRNAVCVSKNNEVTFSTSNKPVTFSEMILHLSKDNNCHSALYLDGAISGVYVENIQVNNMFQSYGPMIAVSLSKPSH